MKHLGLFEGIGGFSLAARWAGWETVAWCEINPFCQKVLKYHFPRAEGFTDIKQTDFTKYKNAVDVATGGFPCQPWSTSGEQKGEQDERHLFPEMFRAIREIEPRWIVAENVYGLATEKFRSTLNNIYTSLESIGYETLPPLILPVSAVDAPHERYRVWIIAHADSLPGSDKGPGQDRSKKKKGEGQWNKWKRFRSEFKRISEAGIITDATGSGWVSWDEGSEPEQLTQSIPDWRGFPTQSPVCLRNDGISSRLDGITFPKLRRESIKAGGNAIAPKLCLDIFKAINEYEASHE